MAIKESSAAETLAAFRTVPARKRTYTADPRAKRAPVPAISDAAYVTRGVHATTEAPVLLVQDGSAQTAITLAAVGAAIAGGVITAAEIDALLGR